MPQPTAPVYKIGLYTGIAIVVANMVGTGVFTSLGFQVLGIRSGFALLMLWLVGGVIALCGALCYGELAAALPRSGGEYHYLSRIYHPAVGFLSGWVSATVGFAAPTALAAIALGRYATSVWPELHAGLLSLLAVALITIVHLISQRAGSRFQIVVTALKVALLLLFIGAGLLAEPQPLAFRPSAPDWQALCTPAFAVSLIYVSYAYSGWNAAVYLAGEVEQPQRNLPRALLIGTATVALLYVLLNYVFLRTTPLNMLAGQLEIGYLSANQIFGVGTGQLMGAVIALLLVSTVSSMIYAGPRIIQIMGEDLPALRWLARRSRRGLPVRATLLQSLLTVVFIITATFEQVLVYAGFVLSLFTFLTVLGLFVLRWRQPELPRPYRTWGYPLTPLVFLALNGWTLAFLLRDKFAESMLGLATVLVGLLVYAALAGWGRMRRKISVG
ncbi:amino acid permease [Hymenobacter busanensis]|uniref:Amino acid permease n=1 Tax=Hymenobacter busanensis TaxID=2607656 RepID=A0A7L5A1Y6_9BACT|nr:amino acid permease [Hymenobacter busanensis]KAA9325588.1 amino acid permease [Hymenobacter busanensis]QHJ07740.1 amino acid permease [Hymenobacter busanensis]